MKCTLPSTLSLSLRGLLLCFVCVCVCMFGVCVYTLLFLLLCFFSALLSIGTCLFLALSSPSPLLFYFGPWSLDEEERTTTHWRRKEQTRSGSEREREREKKSSVRRNVATVQKIFELQLPCNILCRGHTKQPGKKIANFKLKIIALQIINTVTVQAWWRKGTEGAQDKQNHKVHRVKFLTVITTF